MSRARRRILPLFIPHLGCPHACVFCSQRRVTGRETPVTPAEVSARLSLLSAPVDELAFYGGSFTALPEAEFLPLLDAVQPFIKSGAVGAVRVSTRPDAVDAHILSLLRDRHVSTVELGAQSMSDAVLRQCGRGHTAADTVRASGLVRAAGCSLVLQMMTGLPGSSAEADVETAKALCALRPNGARIYPTVILRGTELETLWRSGAYREHTVTDAVEVCARILPLFEAAGVPVIRLGLNPTETLSAGGAAGGAYHPALGELVHSRVYLERARALLRASCPGRRAALGVSKSEISKMTGRRQCNLRALEQEFRLERVRVAAAEVPKGEIILVSESTGDSGLQVLPGPNRPDL